MTTFKAREHAMEEMYFNREEAKMLQKMASKLRKKADQNDGKGKLKLTRFAVPHQLSLYFLLSPSLLSH